jgi:hypothetical protein
MAWREVLAGRDARICRIDPGSWSPVADSKKFF